MAKRVSALTAFLLFVFCSVSFAGALPLFGPRQYARSAGKPAVYGDAFEACDTGASYSILVENGDAAGANRISSASVVVNGEEVVKQSDLSQKVDRIERPVTLRGENTLDVKLASGPGGFIRVSVNCTANCLDIKITSPKDASTINRPMAVISGNLYNAFGETGVAINGKGAYGVTGVTINKKGEYIEAAFLAHRSGGIFAGTVPLQGGVNTLTAMAADACGWKAVDTIGVTVSTVAESLTLSALPSSGIISSQTNSFQTVFEMDTNLSHPIANYSWDFNGDGTAEQAGKDLSRVTADYTRPGLYFPTLTITDTLGNRYTETTVVNVMSMAEMDTLLKGKWDGMKVALAGGDVEKAVRFLLPWSKERYHGIFTAIKGNRRPIASSMNDIQLIDLSGKRAKYRIRRGEPAGAVTYYIYFELDENGIWRIRQF